MLERMESRFMKDHSRRGSCLIRFPSLWLALVMVRTKIFIQDIWLLDHGARRPVMEILGFVDASEKARSSEREKIVYLRKRENSGNPADCASRGLSPGHFAWQGPSWLSGVSSQSPEVSLPDQELPEQRNKIHVMAAGLSDEKVNLLTRYSSLQKLLRVTACHRWRHSLGIRGDTTVDPGLLRQRFWVPSGRMLIKSHIRRCHRCMMRAATSQQVSQGDLPPRVTPSRPFTYTGVNYAGPVILRTSPGRGHKAHKITILHPGQDGYVRVVTVKTASSEFARPLVKIILRQ
ncbi:hypothetical protein ALC53_12000 [Atta colombica]|uniref:DUF5641 domain-containing protein n=1 Tax=Atta colombica TaxID=520822 RepID=A0A151HZP5_9HYME|nr:hypothetical protein ALC53_12000 [Atta colombica]